MILLSTEREVCVNLEANLYTDLSFIISSLDDAASDDVIHPRGAYGQPLNFIKE
jgi:hypothetical protein